MGKTPWVSSRSRRNWQTASFFVPVWAKTPSECCEKQCLTLFHWKLSAFSRVNVLSENFVAQCEVLNSVDLSGSQRLFSRRLGQTSWAEWLINCSQAVYDGLCNVSGVIRSVSSNNCRHASFCSPLLSLAHSLFFSPSLCVQCPKSCFVEQSEFFLISSLLQHFLTCIWECCFCMHYTKWRFKQFGRLNLEMPRTMHLRPIATGNDDRHRWCRVSQIRNLMLNDGRWSYSYNMFMFVCFGLIPDEQPHLPHLKRITYN